MKDFFGKKYFTISAIIFVVIACLLFFFKSHIFLFIWKLNSENPVTWNNVRVHLDNKMIYKIDEAKITLIYWDSIPAGRMSISKLNINNLSQISDVLVKQDYLILSSDIKSLNGYKSIFIKHKKRNQNDIHQSIYIIPLNLLIHFTGPEESYSSFRDVINNLEFLSLP